MGYTSIHSHAVAAFQSVSSQSHKPAENPPTSSSVTPNQASYHMLPPQPPNGFVPVMYWPPPNTYPPPGPSFGYQSFLSTGNYITLHPPPYFSHPYCNPMIPKLEDRAGKRKMDAGLEGADSDYVTSSSSA